MTLIQFTSVYSAWVQLDLADAREATGIGGAMMVACALTVLAGLVGWFVQPKVSIRHPSAEHSEPLPLAATARVVWIGEVRPSRGYLWLMGFLMVLLVGGIVATFVDGAPGGIRILMAALTAVLVPLVIAGSWFRVRIDQTRLEARSRFGWPVFRLPAQDVQRVEATQISPFSEFGGIGMRWAPGRFGIVMRAGEGIVATRRDGRIFAVTLDHADQAAAALTTAAERAERSP